MSEPEEAPFLIVCLEPGLHHSRLSGLIEAFLSYPGVRWSFGPDMTVLQLTEAQRTLLSGEPLPIANRA